MVWLGLYEDLIHFSSYTLTLEQKCVSGSYRIWTDRARAVLERAKVFKFDLAICDPYLTAANLLPDNIRAIGMDEALNTGDIISLHIPPHVEKRTI